MNGIGKDPYGNNRDRTLALKISSVERKLFDKYVELSGVHKNTYAINRLLCTDFQIIPNPRIYKALKDNMLELFNEIKRVEKAGDLPQGFIELTQAVMTVYDGLKGENDGEFDFQI